MPRTRRNKLVSLTKTPKRNTRSARAGHMDVIQEAASSHPTCIVFLLSNQRNVHLQEVRSLWKENSRMFVGKNRVMSKALGLDAESEAQPGLHGISKRLSGPVGILFTTSTPVEVQAWFDDYSREDFARAGNAATQDVILEAGPVMLALDPPEALPHSLEPQLRALGMPTELKRGVPTLNERFVVCRKGDKLTSEKAQILKHLLIKDAKFRLIPVAYWTKGDESVTDYTLTAHDEQLVRATRLAAEKVKQKSSHAARNSTKSSDRKQDEIMADQASDDDDDDDDDYDDDVEIDDEEDEIESRDRGMMMPVGV